MSEKFRALIIDDEENARILLKELLVELQCFGEIRLARSSANALREMNQFNPDIVFLDIKMPGKDGFSFIHDLPPGKAKPIIVIVTAFDQYAIRAIKNQAFDYLLKPVGRKELKQCVQRLIDTRSAEVVREKAAGNSSRISRIKINTRAGIVFINPSAILFCKADGNYTRICTGEKEHLCCINLGRIWDVLPEDGFIRMGRSHIINVEYVTLLDRKEGTLTLQRERESVTLKIPKQHLKDFEIT